LYVGLILAIEIPKAYCSTYQSSEPDTVPTYVWPRPSANGPAISVYDLENANPYEDARTAIRSNDMRLFGIQGYHVQLPGLNEDDKPLVTQGYRIIKGSEGSSCYKERRLIVIAELYAEVYNECILQALRTQLSARLVQSLAGYNSLTNDWIVGHADIGRHNSRPKLLAVDISSKCTTALISHVKWYRPVVDGESPYTWHALLGAVNEVVRAASKQAWLVEWLAVSANRTVEAHINGVTLYADPAYGNIVPRICSKAGLSTPFPDCEIRLCEGSKRRAIAFLATRGEKAIIIESEPHPQSSSHWLDSISLGYRPKLGSLEFLVVDVTGSWYTNSLPIGSDGNWGRPQ
jgi:hypothetical protein